jgi:hypothetical protein
MSDRGTWKIAIGATDVADYTEVVRGEPVGGGSHFMDVAGYGAADLVYLDLGNRALTRRFVITTQHADNAESVDWYLNGAQSLNGVADVTLTHRDHSGDETIYLITGARVTLEVDEPIGVTTTTRINITGGAAILQP